MTELDRQEDDVIKSWVNHKSEVAKQNALRDKFPVILGNDSPIPHVMKTYLMNQCLKFLDGALEERGMMVNVSTEG